jgi:hypothetical protein
MTSVAPTIYRGSAEPATGRAGDLWVDTTSTPEIKAYDGAAWNSIVVIPEATEVNPPSWIRLASDYTLTNTTSAQKYFNTTSNGAVTLPVGTYEFEWLVMLDQMSTTSGNAEFNILGAGTATVELVGMSTSGKESSNPENIATLSGQASRTVLTDEPSVTAATTDAMHLFLIGIFKISAEGTMIPSVRLTTGVSSCLAKSGSYFKVKKIGESGVNYTGAWT